MPSPKHRISYGLPPIRPALPADFEILSEIDPSLKGKITLPHLEYCEEGFISTLPSRASRKIALRSKASKRGAIVTHFGAPRAVVFESHLELMTALMILRIKGVSELIDQPTPVIFVDQDGVFHKHTFDYLAVFESGARMAVAVKPYERAVAKNLRLTLELIAAQNPTYADKFFLITEKNFSRIDVSNATIMHAISSEVDEEVDARVLGLINAMAGSCTIGELVRVTRAGGRGYRSVVRHLASHHLRLMTKSHISYGSMVTRTAA